MSNKNFLRRRGEHSSRTASSSSSPSNVSLLQWRQGFCISRVKKSGRFGLLVVLILCIYVWRNAWTSQQPSLAKQQQHHEGERLVVALSTIPSRIHLLQPTLESLIDKQTLKPDTVYLTLPQKKAHSNNMLLNYTLPDFIQHYQTQGLLTVLTPEYDYGSIMKVLHVLQVEHENTRIVYVDDDWIYHESMLQLLYDKSTTEYPNDALCLNGGMLQTYFRQIGHTTLDHNHYPYLFMETSGTPSHLLGGKDHAVDIAQGFCSVLVQPKFFHVNVLLELLQQSKLPVGVVKSDDFILSAHLEYRNVTRMLVSGGTAPQLVTQAAGIDKLSLHMYRHAISAAYYLQGFWNIWQNYKFYNPALLTKQEWNAIDCEAGRGKECDGYQQVLRELEKKYPPS